MIDACGGAGGEVNRPGVGLLCGVATADCDGWSCAGARCHLDATPLGETLWRGFRIQPREVKGVIEFVNEAAFTWFEGRRKASLVASRRGLLLFGVAPVRGDQAASSFFSLPSR
jgi:hypothetical protein